MAEKTHYEVLQITESASEAEIKASYKALAQRLHPDRNTSVDATGQFQRVAEAYRVLSDAGSRAEYDSELAGARRMSNSGAESNNNFNFSNHTNSTNKNHAKQKRKSSSDAYDSQSSARTLIRDQAIRSLFWGAAISATGFGLSLWSYSSASEGGGRYAVFAGAMLFGCIKIIRSGFSLYRLHSRKWQLSRIWSYASVGTAVSALIAVYLGTAPSADTYQQPHTQDAAKAPDVQTAHENAPNPSEIGANSGPPQPKFTSKNNRLVYLRWLGWSSDQLKRHIENAQMRVEFLEFVWHESARAGIPPSLVLSYIDCASGFRKFFIGKNGSRGYMKILPDVPKNYGKQAPSILFQTQPNLRYGVTLLRQELENANGVELIAIERFAEKYSGEEDPSNFAKQVIAKTAYWNLPATD